MNKEHDKQEDKIRDSLLDSVNCFYRERKRQSQNQPAGYLFTSVIHHCRQPSRRNGQTDGSWLWILGIQVVIFSNGAWNVAKHRKLIRIEFPLPVKWLAGLINHNRAFAPVARLSIPGLCIDRHTRCEHLCNPQSSKCSVDDLIPGSLHYPVRFW